MDFNLPETFFLRVPYVRTDSTMDRSTDSAMDCSTDSTSGHFFMTCTVHVPDVRLFCELCGIIFGKWNKE